MIERAVIRSPSGKLDLDLPTEPGLQPSPSRPSATSKPQTDGDIIPEEEMRRRECENILTALRKTNWQIYGSGGAAELLGIKSTTLASRIKKMGLKKAE